METKQGGLTRFVNRHEAVTHRALDGSVLELQGPIQLDAPATNSVGVRWERRNFRLSAGTQDFAASKAQAVIGLRSFQEEYKFRAGTLKLGRVAHFDRTAQYPSTRRVAVWEGEYSSAMLSRWGGRIDEIVGFLDCFNFLDSPIGLQLTVRRQMSRAVEFVRAPIVLKRIPGLGLLDMSQRTRTKARLEPTWQGLSVAGGELFGDDYGDNGQVLYLVSATTHTEINVDPDVTFEKAVALASNLRIAWQVST